MGSILGMRGMLQGALDDLAFRPAFRSGSQATSAAKDTQTECEKCQIQNEFQKEETIKWRRKVLLKHSADFL
ncbi:MAG: hypothetical protein CMN76_15670 [Spirochaetaceae bacterium]|nr:hypothetical protein [Spirochaetaceae bacterium]